MQKIVIMRFGPPTPIFEINAALKPHFADKLAKAFPMPGGVMSVFNTESSIEEVTASIKETGVPVPFFIFPFNADACQLPPQAIAAITGEADNGTSAPTRTPTMDEVLEKISATGIESLTPEEKAVLNAGA
jgi:hypothetical protein